jgi:hypothetical protein
MRFDWDARKDAKNRRDNDETIRIISARRATKAETRRYASEE